MKKIKILRIIARLNIGGPAIHTILLTQGLDKSKFETLLVCGHIDKEEGDMLYYSRQRNIEPVFIPELKRELDFFGDIAALRKICDIIRAEKPDIIHTHTAKAGTIGRLAGILFNLSGRRIKLIHTFHGHVFQGYFGKLKTKFFILIERILAIFTSRIIVVSESLKKELISLGISKENKIDVIPLGFELGNFLEIPLKDAPALNIGIIGRLVPIKNHRLFLESAVKVVADNPGMKLRFEIVGDGELRKELEEYARELNIEKHVDFLGWQTDLAGIYSRLDIVALTSINEGTPVSLIEAMASARPVVATDVGGIRDLLGEGINISKGPGGCGFEVLERGVIVEPGDPFSFAAALNFILANSALRKDTTARGRDFVKVRFQKDRLIKDMEGLYNSLFDSRQKL